MGLQVRITYYGEPVAQQRPKFSTQGGFVRAVDPVKSRNYKAALRFYAQTEMQKLNGRLLSGPLMLRLTVCRSIPTSWSKKKQEMAERREIRPTTKPDCSNYLKGVEDALNGTVYSDDSQIVTTITSKYYSKTPRITVVLEELNLEKKE